MNAQLFATLVALLSAGNAALLRALREDVSWCKTLGEPWRQILVIVLSLVTGPALTAAIAGASVKEALFAGAAAALTPIASLVVSALKGKPKPDIAPVTLRSEERGLVDVAVLGAICIFSVVAAFALSGCAGSFEESKLASKSPSAIAAYVPSPRCTALDDAHRNWTVAAAFGAGFAGASGLATLPVSDDARPYVALTALTLAASTGAAVVMADSYSQTWVRECQ